MGEKGGSMVTGCEEIPVINVPSVAGSKPGFPYMISQDDSEPMEFQSNVADVEVRDVVTGFNGNGHDDTSSTVTSLIKIPE